VNKLPYAEDINYWKSGTSSPETWIQKTIHVVREMGGSVTGEGFGSEPNTGCAAFMLAFEIQGARYKVVWPVLPSRGKNDKAARIQAATMLYHDIKAKCLSAAVLGAQAAFFSYLLLPDGRTAVEASFPELRRGIPALFASVGPQLGPGDDVIDGEVVG
jgi:hypothetical protein